MYVHSAAKHLNSLAHYTYIASAIYQIQSNQSSHAQHVQKSKLKLVHNLIYSTVQQICAQMRHLFWLVNLTIEDRIMRTLTVGSY